MAKSSNTKIILLVCIGILLLLIYSLFDFKWIRRTVVNAAILPPNLKNLKETSAIRCPYCNMSNYGVNYGVNQEDLDMQKLHFEKMSATRRNSIKNEKSLASLQMYIVPQITCSTAVRVGAVADGGKWVCNPWRVQNPCIIYSFGVNGDTSFEQEMFSVTKEKCKIFCFDIIQQRANLFKSFNGVFRNWAISDTTNTDKNQWSILDIAKNFSHDKIDIIKMDIEAAEFSSLPPLLKSEVVSSGKVCQLLIELHTNVNSWKQLQNQLEKSGFLMFYKEANMFCPTCFEYSYIHKSCLVLFGVYSNVFNNNFD